MVYFGFLAPNPAVHTIIYPNAIPITPAAMRSFGIAAPLPLGYSTGRLVRAGTSGQLQRFVTVTQPVPFLANPLQLQQAAHAQSVGIDQHNVVNDAGVVVSAPDSVPDSVTSSVTMGQQDVTHTTPAASVRTRTLGNVLQMPFIPPFSTSTCHNRKNKNAPPSASRCALGFVNTTEETQQTVAHQETASAVQQHASDFVASEANYDGQERPSKRLKRSDQWDDQFQSLCRYHAQMGHCCIPLHDSKHAALFHWVKRQRHQYKLMKEGRSSKLTLERIKALDELGFVWDFQSSRWDERFDELRDYKRQYGQCNVPSTYSKNRKLGTWVKIQRRQKKLMVSGQRSSMTVDRMRRLDQLGFVWEIHGKGGWTA